MDPPPPRQPDLVAAVDCPVAVAASTGSALEISAVAVKAPARKHISVFSAFMMLTTWSTSSSNVLYPFTFGVLGSLGGPLLMLVAFAINWRVTRWTVEAAIATRSETFGGLGHALMGRRGRVLFEGSQLLFQQLFLPVAIVLCSGAVQSLLGGKHAGGAADGFASCNGNVALVFAAVSFGLVQVSRQLESVVALAYISSALNLIMTLTIALEVMTHEPPASSAPAAPVELFVGVGDHPGRYHWANVLAAVGTFVYSCLPSCIVVETMATVRPSERHRMPRAVDGSFVAYILIYLLAGLPAVLRWGGDVPEPIRLANTPGGVVVKLILIYGTLLDFVLASITVNRATVRVLDPKFDYRWDGRNALRWAAYCLPSSLVAVGMALFVPRLESLTGLLNSVAGATLQMTAVPLCLCLTANRDARRAMRLEQGAVPRYAATACYGVAFTVAVLVSACYSMSVTRYAPAAGETYWCDLAG